MTRGLTDTSGILSVSDVKPGLYEAISLYPYGYWVPAVREFIVDKENVSLQIRLNGSVRDAVPASERRIAVKVVGSDGSSVKGATVLGRDLTAEFLKFSSTDENGRATITIPSEAAQIVVVYKGNITVQDVNAKADSELHGGSTASAAEQAALEILIHIPSRAD